MWCFSIAWPCEIFYSAHFLCACVLFFCPSFLSRRFPRQQKAKAFMDNRDDRLNRLMTTVCCPRVCVHRMFTGCSQHDLAPQATPDVRMWPRPSSRTRSVPLMDASFLARCVCRYNYNLPNLHICQPSSTSPTRPCTVSGRHLSTAVPPLPGPGYLWLEDPRLP